MVSLIETERAESIGWREEGKDRFEPRQGEKQKSCTIDVVFWICISKIFRAIK